jgi:haloacetate dehalogenase
VTDLFPGFDAHWIDTKAGRVFARTAGSGPPLLLLHGFPQTQACWHKIAPALARTHSVVLMDLRGYGWSSAPRGDARHDTYAKRAMGEDAVAVMERLGHVRFALLGHDRGARVGYRLALDHPGRLERLALVDILPTAHVWSQIRTGAMPGAHWEFLSRPEPGPETEIGRDPIPYFEGLMAKWTLAGSLEPFDRTALRAYRDGFNETTRIHAFCEDYRAGATRDLEADEADLAAGRRILCPVFVAWGDFFLTGQSPETPLDIWRRTFAPHATGAKIAGAGHFIPEENPAGLLAVLEPFLAG